MSSTNKIINYLNNLTISKISTGFKFSDDNRDKQTINLQNNYKQLLNNPPIELKNFTNYKHHTHNTNIILLSKYKIMSKENNFSMKENDEINKYLNKLETVSSSIKIIKNDNNELIINVKNYYEYLLNNQPIVLKNIINDKL